MYEAPWNLMNLRIYYAKLRETNSFKELYVDHCIILNEENFEKLTIRVVVITMITH